MGAGEFRAAIASGLFKFQQDSGATGDLERFLFFFKHLADFVEEDSETHLLVIGFETDQLPDLRAHPNLTTSEDY